MRNNHNVELLCLPRYGATGVEQVLYLGSAKASSSVGKWARSSRSRDGAAQQQRHTISVFPSRKEVQEFKDGISINKGCKIGLVHYYLHLLF